MNKANVSGAELAALSPQEFRMLVRRRDWVRHKEGELKDYQLTSSDSCRGYARTALAIVPQEYAFSFLLFCHRNPHVFGVTDVNEAGSARPMLVAPETALRTDLLQPDYPIQNEPPADIAPNEVPVYWGCSILDTVALEASCL